MNALKIMSHCKNNKQYLFLYLFHYTFGMKYDRVCEIDTYYGSFGHFEKFKNCLYLHPSLSLMFTGVFCSCQDVKKVSSPSYSYHQGAVLLCYTETSPPHPPSSLQGLFGPTGGDSEGSHSSEGSHETGDSGRYSHDDTEATNLSLGVGSRPASLQGEESEASDEVTEKEPMTEVTETTLQQQEMMEPHPV